jgi:hypothetical protein
VLLRGTHTSTADAVLADFGLHATVASTRELYEEDTKVRRGVPSFLARMHSAHVA